MGSRALSTGSVGSPLNMDTQDVGPDQTPNPKNERKKRKKISRRKRITHLKKGRYQKQTKLPIGIDDIDLAECVLSDNEEREEFVATLIGSNPLTAIPEENQHFEEEQPTTQSNAEAELSDSSSRSEPVLPQSAAFGLPVLSPPQSSSAECSPTLTLIESGLQIFRNILPSPWVAIADTTGFYLLFLSHGTNKSIQRTVYMPYDGKEDIFVHCVPFTSANILLDSILPLRGKFVEGSVENFCQRGLSIVKKLFQYSICVGADHIESKEIWNTVHDAYVDQNPFQEKGYTETCRSVACSRLIELGRGKRCTYCSGIIHSLRKRPFIFSDNLHSKTSNKNLTHTQALHKLRVLSEELKRKDSKIAYLSQRYQEIVQSEGVDIDEEVSNDLSGILSDHNLSPVQRMFLDEQLKLSQARDARAHRWHPSIIRLALHIKMVSSSAYESLRDSGVIKLPTSRTLYDYSRAIACQDGISDGIIKIVNEKISKSDEPHQKHVALLMDEMHVSKNLIYRQCDGSLIGYAHLDDVDKEIARFEQHLSGGEPPQAHLASKVLAFMVKGLTSSVKYVVASYPCNQVTKDMIFKRVWSVIERLEKGGVKVLALVCDGASVNRSFFDMHTPITKTNSGVIFDTLNLFAPEERPLYFVADVAHLIKTIRNCFHNSGEEEKKPRCLEYNNQKIKWKTIVRLYLTYKSSNFRKSYKLNSQNVFPTSYSCMKVRFAAEVLSNTVALDIKAQNWPDTSETVSFIQKCDQFFDSLNGAHSSQHISQRKPNLAPYTSNNCEDRFKKLHSFLDYLESWRKQAAAKYLLAADQEKAQLSLQTRRGIEIAIRGVEGSIRFLLKEGAQFVMARAFSQDPLEQFFSRQRAAGGGSSNPNVSQFLANQVNLTVQRDLGVRRRRSNVEDDGGGLEITNEPLPKRKAKRRTVP